MIIGKRKFITGLVYLALAPALVAMTGSTEGITAIMVGCAPGVAIIIYGNVMEHKANNVTP